VVALVVLTTTKSTPATCQMLTRRLLNVLSTTRNHIHPRHAPCANKPVLEPRKGLRFTPLGVLLQHSEQQCRPCVHHSSRMSEEVHHHRQLPRMDGPNLNYKMKRHRQQGKVRFYCRLHTTRTRTWCAGESGILCWLSLLSISSEA